MAKADKVSFQYTARVLHSFKDGKPLYLEKGSRLTITRSAAEKFQRQGIGKILEDAKPIEVKGEASA
jgi:hypothetical protein